MSVSTIAIKQLEEKHLAAAQILSTAVKWPHRRQEWKFALSLGRGLAAMDGDSLVGTTIWYPFGRQYARFGMVVVSPSIQRRGIGRLLMESALRDAGDRTILLNASEEGRRLYEKLGFKPIGAVRQHETANAVPASAPPPEGARFRSVEEIDLDAVIALDEQAAGFRRSGMLRALKEISKGLILEQGGEIAAWSFFRRFGHGYVIGPVGARDEMAAQAVIARWIADNRSEFQRIDVPLPSGLSPWLEGQGLARAGEVVTMALGEAPALLATGPRLFALANQGFG
ncbi:GNAT family N-acetyltransferase [Mesorhizobium sp.]|uniref:GNAT family N-acetyltransferase n=1 Tax=Mesorhizobium sp. TaxID=1871066 RepID=UPI000FE36B88|nr:GNAT family N-acetyltransferase [Mesorhizobium sp.]RWN50113.1 MAG: N-acetyltransferase [Mesorhizobium sp.]RWN68943.1 MAG: N-acetyltransferase [Mesorhizobium sp.]RWN69598.1 MAG: N-acetyltransferase [Mesorhizobium sp.]RWN81238.1 MAG: N-acetyltransferase [Mesorhizobium sp.]RWO06224.1 MAG: N-acetyltransferase [Mesorhizobium sp.]